MDFEQIVLLDQWIMISLLLSLLIRTFIMDERKRKDKK